MMLKSKVCVISYLGFDILWPEEIFWSSEMVIIYLENSYVIWRGVFISVVTWFSFTVTFIDALQLAVSPSGIGKWGKEVAEEIF